MGMLHKVEEVRKKNSLFMISLKVIGKCIVQVVVVSSPRCCVSRFWSAQSMMIPLSVWSACTLKQKVGVALPSLAAPPPKKAI